MALSHRELRRMAYQVARRPGMREVLHDALLETFPSYHEVIANAERDASALAAAFDVPTPLLVLFNPRSLVRGRGRNPLHRESGAGWRDALFPTFFGLPMDLPEIKRQRRTLRNAVWVYATKRP